MKDLIKALEKKGMVPKFGLEAQGHIPTIEAIIKKWNDSYAENFPNEPSDLKYEKHVWEEIGKEIGWCSFSAALAYFEYLEQKNS